MRLTGKQTAERCDKSEHEHDDREYAVGLGQLEMTGSHKAAVYVPFRHDRERRGGDIEDHDQVQPVRKKYVGKGNEKNRKELEKIIFLERYRDALFAAADTPGVLPLFQLDFLFLFSAFSASLAHNVTPHAELRRDRARKP